MEICTIASGSSGNCSLVSHGDTHILIDAGISMRRIKTALASFGITPDMINGIVITHEHTDHISGLKMLNKYYKIPVYATFGTTEGILCGVPELEDSISAFHAGDGFTLGSMELTSFPTPHDARESVGYTVSADSRTLSFVTDIGYVTRSIFESVKGSDTVVLESNHDIEMLSSGPYPYFLKQRILSHTGHLSNPDCAALAAELVRSGTRRLILAHLSRENNTPSLAYNEVMGIVSYTGVSPEDGFELSVAGPDVPGPLYTI